MRKSESGLSDIVVMVSVMMSVVTCCVGFYLYEVAERNRLQIKRLEAHSKFLELKTGDLVAEARDIALKAGFKSESGLPSAKPLIDLRDALKAELKLAGSDSAMQDALIPMQGKVFTAETRLQLAKYNREAARDNRDETKSRLAMIETTLNVENDRLKGRFDELSKQLSEEGNAFAERVDSLTQEETKLREEAVTLTRKYQDEQMRIGNENSRLEQELQRLQQREALVRDITRPAGKILFADRNGRYAYIDLGQDSNVQEGMKFLVYRTGKGGVREDKGEVEVKHIYPTQVQVSITREDNDKDPIIEGDLIENPLYRGPSALPRVVVLLGTFNQRDYHYTLDEIKARLVRAGVKIEDKVTIHTDYIIKGTEIAEDDAVYKQALLLSVPSVDMARILKYLGD